MLRHPGRRAGLRHRAGGRSCCRAVSKVIVYHFGRCERFFRRYARADEVAQENEALRSEINELRAQLVNYEEYKHENEELRKYLDIEYKEEHPDFEMTPAAGGRARPGQPVLFIHDRQRFARRRRAVRSGRLQRMDCWDASRRSA